MQPAIVVENLGKRYRINHEASAARNGRSYRTLRESMTDWAAGPLRRLRRAVLPTADCPPPTATTEDFWALKDVSFEVQPGEVVGIIGRNGAGKSTLLKILSRITKPTTGQVRLRGRVGSLLEVGTGFHPELTGRENIYLNGSILGMTRTDIRNQFDEIVEFSGVSRFLDTPVKRYSSGMYVRLAFAVAAHLNTEILIVDEVLAVGDSEFQRRCLGKMKSVATSGRTVLFVSHNMGAVQTLCQRAFLLSFGSLTLDNDSPIVVARYMGAASQSEVGFEDGALKRVRVLQHGGVLRIEADYSHTEALLLPGLGFVISDGAGTPIFGLNPRISGVGRAAVASPLGTVRATISAPRLLDGTYSLSVWFGDSDRDFVSHPHCLRFEVSGWAGSRQLSASVVGPVFPECVWSFETTAC